MNRIGTGSHEGLDFEVLFDGLEEEFDLPTLLVNGSNGACGEFEVVGQENDLPHSNRIREPPSTPTQARKRKTTLIL